MWTDDFDFDDWNDDVDPEDIYRLLKDIESEMAAFPKERPIFSDKQAMSFEDLEIGKRYEKYHKGGWHWTIVLVSMPYLRDGDWWIDAYREGSAYVTDNSLSDMGITPYGDKWSPTNWLEVLD